MGKTITKDQIVYEISADTSYSSAMVRCILNSMFTNVEFELSRGNRVQFNGFGTFEMKKRAARIGRNPHTKEAVPIPARVVPSFTPGEVLKRASIKETK